MKISFTAASLSLAWALMQAWTLWRREGAYHLLDAAPLLLASTFWVWLTGRYLWGSPGSARRYYRQSKLRDQMEYTWDDAGFGVTGDKLNSRYDWSDFIRWSEDRAALVIWTTERSYVPLPKHLVSDALLDDLGTRLQRVRRA